MLPSNGVSNNVSSSTIVDENASIIRSLYDVFKSTDTCTNLFAEGIFGMIYSSLTSQWSVSSLSDCWQYRHNSAKCILVVVDPQPQVTETSNTLVTHSWRLRNLLALLSLHANDVSSSATVDTTALLPTRNVKIIAFRGPLLCRAMNFNSIERMIEMFGKQSMAELGRLVYMFIYICMFVYSTWLKMSCAES